MKTNYIQRLTLTAILILSFVFTATAQENPKYVCDVNANNTVDLSLDVIGNGFRPDGGQWYQVPAGTYTQNGASVTGFDINDSNNVKVSNIFVLAGKAPGTYNFVFVANASNACIPVGNQKLATVIILETPKPLSTSLSLCPSETTTLDLQTLISNTLPTATFSNVAPAAGGTLTGSNLAIGANFEGEVTVDYTVDHPNATVCEGPAKITIKVTRDGTVPVVQGPSDINYCVKEVPASLNLNSKLTAIIPGATWSVTNSGTGSAAVSGAIASFTNPTNGDAYTFTYTWAAGTCYAAGSVAFTVNIKDDLSTDFANKAITVCKSNNSSAVIDMLRDGLGVAIPLSTGAWNVLTPDNNPSDITVTDGLFEVSGAKPGEYKYRFDISNATGLCGLDNKSAELTITVTDAASTQDGRMEFCLADVNAASGNITLSDYVQNLPATGVTWSTNLTNITITGTNNNEVANSELAAKGVGTHKFTYSYNAGTCGTVTGDLYLTVTDALDMENVALKYCRPDLPSELDLTNALGVNVPGTWSYTSGGATGSVTGNKFSETAGTTGDKTYVATFTPSTNNCGAKTATVTITVTDNQF